MSRWLLIALGWLAVVLGTLGVVLPLLPTTPFYFWQRGALLAPLPVSSLVALPLMVWQLSAHMAATSCFTSGH